MGAVVVLAPVIATAWPVVSASILGAAAALGFAAAAKKEEAAHAEKVGIEVEGSACVSGALGRDERLSFTKDGVSLTFSRDARGACAVDVSGAGRTRAELEAIGRDFAGRVVQQYAYNQVMQELAKRNFAVVSQDVGTDRTIHVQVRRYA
ncbi:MAG: DUF1257 domain-containing protein [Planctomycetota bacterium]